MQAKNYLFEQYYTQINKINLFKRQRKHSTFLTTFCI